MNNINWKVRLKNKQFLTLIFLSILTPIATYFNITGADLSTWSALFDLLLKAASNPFIVFTIVLSVYNAIVDPTTTGISDSIKALDYDKPHKD